MRVNTMICLCFLPVVFLGLTGCGTEGNYKIAMDSWHGAPETALVHSWGQPDEVDPMQNGNKMYVYRVNEQASAVKVFPQNIGRISTQPSASIMRLPSSGISTGSYSFSCETQFEINRHGVIINSTFSGNNCVSTKNNAKRWSY